MSNDNVTTSGSLTVSSDSNTLTTTNVCTIDPKYWEYYTGIKDLCPSSWEPIPANIKKCKGGDENMRYLYEVFLVNPKNDTCFADKIIARSEISALMKTYHNSEYDGKVDFDDLKTSCRVLMEWKKKESLKKAIETIKKAVE